MKYRNQKEKETRNKRPAEKTAERSRELTCCCDNKVSAVSYKEFAVFGLKINLHVKRRRCMWHKGAVPPPHPADDDGATTAAQLLARIEPKIEEQQHH